MEALLLVCQAWDGIEVAAKRSSESGLSACAYRPDVTDDPIVGALVSVAPEVSGAGWALYRVEPEVLKDAAKKVTGVRRLHIDRLVG